MELLKEETQKDVRVSRDDIRLDNESEATEIDRSILYDSFRDRFNLDYEDDF